MGDMSFQSMANFAFILVGAIIMFLGIIRSKNLMEVMPFIPERHQKSMLTHLLIHRALMAFFLLGYLASLAALVMKFSLISETFVSLIFLFGAVFVYIGVTVQTHLMTEIQQTIQGILPICVKCKKIQAAEGDPEDPKEWSRIETYISEKIDVNFSHGYCPDCFKEEMATIEKMK